MYLFSDVFSIPVHFEFFAIFSYLNNEYGKIFRGCVF
jgi:hypothetical protein